ncbi:protein-disulfide isomerase [Aurantiacibacter spongiae]|uniref:Protein-disulfide isomerase n=2 Tax=Aurantiacibacter spongiae TaxID=2488860 RepID=A0A3N5DCU4_9SPHN|nr:protein-disulfide isomerase [Aurantiacibacter spongiae]
MNTRRILTAALAAPLVLALAACADDAATADAVSGDPVAAVPAPAGQAWTDTVSRTEEGGWLVGNPDAPIKLVEYGSLTCPGCAAFSAEGSTPLMQDYVDTGRVSYELRSFLIHGVPDLVLTRMLECADPTAAVPLADQIWAKLHDERAYVFQTDNQAALEQANSLPPERRLPALAEVSGTLDWFAARGISRDQAQACLSDTAAADRLAEVTQNAADAQNVGGTPTFFLNGRELETTPGTSTWTQVEAALQRAGARDS